MKSRLGLTKRWYASGADLLVFDDLSSALAVETEGLLWDRLLAREDKPAWSFRTGASSCAAPTTLLC